MADKYVQSSPTLKYSDGTLVATERIAPQGQMLVDSVHGSMYEASRNGTLFWAANQADVTTTVALATTYTGLCLYNPVGNNRDLIIRAINFKLIVAPAAISCLGIMGGYVSTGGVTAHTTPLVYGTAIWPCNMGSTATPTALVDSAATIVAPKFLWPLSGGFTAGALYPDSAAFIDSQGAWVLQPGAYAAIYTLTVSHGLGSIIWEEVSR
jgi:hypothetical protein